MGSIAATMGGGMGFRASGSGRGVSGIGSAIKALFTPGRQTALTVEEYNAMSRKGKIDYAPGLGGQRALTPEQFVDFTMGGGYRNNLGVATRASGRGIKSGVQGNFYKDFSRTHQVGAFGNVIEIGDFDTGFSPGSSYSGLGIGDSTMGSRNMGASFTNTFSEGPSAPSSISAPSTGGLQGFNMTADEDFDLSFAAGGIVRKMAAGGAIRPRDRVPALLEPGEFVMRRPAAKAIGGAALNHMNATGKTLTPPNIEVNLNNQGAPKNVSAAAPKVQGDKIIIDMITRDLRNNGPIKKSLRK